MNDHYPMYRADITPSESGARVEVYTRLVDPGSQGWFASADQAWADAAARLNSMAAELMRRASVIERMVSRRRSR